MTTLSPVSWGRTIVSEMTDLIEPGPAEPKSGTSRRPTRPAASLSSGGRPIDRRQQKRWVPRLAGWIVLVLGVSFIVVGVNSGLYHSLHHVHSRLHRVAIGTPGTLTLTLTFTRTALIVIGLLLLMLCHGLFRRKHRSWQATMSLLILAAVLNLIRLRHLAITYGLSGMVIGL